jgi:hypothetical protein
MKFPLEAIARRWRNRRNACDTVAALNYCGADATELLAYDIGAPSSELRALAGRWPATPLLLSRRLAAIGLDEAAIGEHQPAVLRDLQRVCSLCSSTGDCEHDLARNLSDPVWHVYCPNETTLEALATERASKGSGQCCNIEQ